MNRKKGKKCVHQFVNFKKGADKKRRSKENRRNGHVVEIVSFEVQKRVYLQSMCLIEKLDLSRQTLSRTVYCTALRIVNEKPNGVRKCYSKNLKKIVRKHMSLKKRVS